MSDSEFDREQREYMEGLAHWNNAAFMAVAAAHYMGIDWRHVPTLMNMLEGREGRTLASSPPEEDQLFTDGNAAGRMIRGACQSPIEELFVCRICSFSVDGRYGRLNLNLTTRWEPEIFRWDRSDGTRHATLFQQLPVEQFRLDFALVGRSRVAIELDGHEFHERTKQQATRDKSRDRKLVELGWKVLRFTGSEVWKDPMLCADEAWRIATTAPPGAP